jgi:hypothetical protein
MDPIDMLDLRRLVARLRPEGGRRFQRGETFVAGCRDCGTELRSMEDALEHAESEHGRDRTSDEARALIHWY